MWANRCIIFIIMIITLLYLAADKNNCNKKSCVQVVTVILTCFSGFRSWQMGDVFHYCYAYLDCNMPGWELDMESHDTIGLQLFFHWAGRLGLSFEVCLFIIAAFTAITIGVLVYRYSPSPYWSYLIYIAMGFYIASFDILKQVIAMGFIVIAMIFIIEKKPVKFLIFVALAALFHYAALVFIIAYPFANKKIDRAYFFMVFAMLAAVFVFRDQIVNQVSEIYYTEGTSYEASEFIGGKTIAMALILVFALLLRPLKEYDIIYGQFFNILVLALVLQTFSVYDNVFTRLADYYYQFSIIFIPLMLQPGSEQAKLYPSHSQEIRYFTQGSYKIIAACITVFAVWYYLRYVDNSSALLEGFHFFWEVDTPSSLDLLKT